MSTIYLEQRPRELIIWLPAEDRLVLPCGTYSRESFGPHLFVRKKSVGVSINTPRDPTWAMRRLREAMECTTREAYDFMVHIVPSLAEQLLTRTLLWGEYDTPPQGAQWKIMGGNAYSLTERVTTSEELEVKSNSTFEEVFWSQKIRGWEDFCQQCNLNDISFLMSKMPGSARLGYYM